MAIPPAGMAGAAESRELPQDRHGGTFAPWSIGRGAQGVNCAYRCVAFP